MKSDELTRKLNSVGKQVFVEQYELFKMHAAGKIDRLRAVRALVDLGVSNESGAGIRVGNAKLIFDTGNEVDALEIILRSSRLPGSVVASAKRLRDTLA